MDTYRYLNCDSTDRQTIGDFLITLITDTDNKWGKIAHLALDRMVNANDLDLATTVAKAYADRFKQDAASFAANNQNHQLFLVWLSTHPKWDYLAFCALQKENTKLAETLARAYVDLPHWVDLGLSPEWAKIREKKSISETKLVIVDSAAPAKAGWGGYRRLGLVEADARCNEDLLTIDKRRRAVVRVISTWESVWLGETERCSYAIAYNEAQFLLGKIEQHIKNVSKALKAKL